MYSAQKTIIMLLCAILLPLHVFGTLKLCFSFTKDKSTETLFKKTHLIKNLSRELEEKGATEVLKKIIGSNDTRKMNFLAAYLGSELDQASLCLALKEICTENKVELAKIITEKLASKITPFFAKTMLKIAHENNYQQLSLVILQNLNNKISQADAKKITLTPVTHGDQTIRNQIKSAYNL